MLKKFTNKYVKLHKCKLGQDDPCWLTENEHGKRPVSAETEHWGDGKEDKAHETPRKTQLLLETIEKVLLARQMQQAQVAKPQLPLALDVEATK